MDRVIILNGEDYLICNEVDLDSKHYIYAIAVEGNKYTVLEETAGPVGTYVQSVKDEDEIMRVFNAIVQGNN